MAKNANAAPRVLEVTLPYERSTKRFDVFSTLASRDPEKRQDDDSVITSLYVRQNGAGKKPIEVVARIDIKYER